MKLPRYNTVQVEAALCIWEAMIELRDTSEALDEVWQDLGTVQMRHHAMELGAYACEVWNSMTEEEQQDCIPYDWEFVPALVKLVGWMDHRPVVTQSPRAMADLVLACLRKPPTVTA